MQRSIHMANQWAPKYGMWHGYPLLFVGSTVERGAAARLVVKDELQWCIFIGKNPRHFCATASGARRCWKETTGQELPDGDDDPLLGCKTIREFIGVTGVFNALEGKT